MDVTPPRALIFDLDGTLFQAETLSLPAYHQMFHQLREEGLFAGDTPPEALFLGGLGMLLSDIWERVLPDSSSRVRSRANQLLLDYQMKFLQEGYGDLYPGVDSTLHTLHERGYQLYLASNGLESYVKEIVHSKELSELFDGVYSAGEFNTPSKVDLVRLLLETHHPESAWMCGDRQSDVEAGTRNGLYVVGCNYGSFHMSTELDGVDLMINDFSTLLNHLPTLE